MRNIYFLFPQLAIPSGGHLAQMRLLEVAAHLAPAQAVTYEGQDDGALFLDDLLRHAEPNNSIFLIHWGPHVPDLIHRLERWNVVYLSYSTGYGFDVPARVPIIAGSRHTQAYWGKHAPASPIYYLPAIISDEFRNLHRERDIDVLVQKRKSSDYLLEELVPRLVRQCAVTLLDSWVEDLAGVFNRSKVYLYDSSDYWPAHGLSEGFGLPPLEALACGCTVFSSINDALSDYLDPGFNCQKLRTYSIDYDLQRILSAARAWQDHTDEQDPAAEYRRHAVAQRLEAILAGLNEFFDYQRQNPGSFLAAGIPAGQPHGRVDHQPSAAGLAARLSRFLPSFLRDWIRAWLSGRKAG